MRSISVEGDLPERTEVINSRRNASNDMFERISSTFNFRHHEGTDPQLELKVIKIILVREGLIMNLKYLSERATASEQISSACTAILEVLAQIRESTLNYLEALCLWRQSIPNAASMSPRVFFWESRNYTLKIVNDIDFLAENGLIIDALQIAPEQFRSNPLMLTNNLDDPNTWMDPVERASADAEGKTEGPVFESRLRLRFGERILLQEIELTAPPIMDPDADGAFMTHQPQQMQQEYNQQQQQPLSLQQQQQQQQEMASAQQRMNPQHGRSHSSEEGDTFGDDRPLMRGSSALESDFDDDGGGGYGYAAGTMLHLMVVN